MFLWKYKGCPNIPNPPPISISIFWDKIRNWEEIYCIHCLAIIFCAQILNSSLVLIATSHSLSCTSIFKSQKCHSHRDYYFNWGMFLKSWLIQDTISKNSCQWWGFILLFLRIVLGNDLLTRCYLAKMELSLILYLKTELFYISSTLLWKVLTCLPLL